MRYFKPCRKNSCQISLPNPTGPLSEKVDSATIEEANTEVTAVIAGTGGKLQPYLKLTDELRATIGCYAAEHDIVNTIHRFKGDFPKDSLKESTIRGGIMLIYYTITKVFPQITRTSCNCKIFPLQTICIIP